MLENIIIQIDSAVTYINPILYDLVAATLIIFVGFITGRLVSALLLKVLQDINVDSRTKEFIPFDKKLSQKIALVIRISIYTISIILALTFLGILFATTIIVILCFVAVLFFSSLFFIRDILPNVFAWFRIRKKIFVGRQQNINKEKGLVVHKTLFAVHLKKQNEEYLIFPNRIIKTIQQKKV